MRTVMTVETAHAQATIAYLARMECRQRCDIAVETTKRPILGKQRMTLTFEDPEDRIRLRRALRDIPEPIPDAVIAVARARRGGFFSRLFS